MRESNFLETTRKRIGAWFDYFAENIESARDDVEFSLFQQWDANARHQRERDGKPCLQFNQLYAHVAAIIGEQRQNTPNIIVHPVSPDADQNAVELRAGLIRQIFYESKSEVAFQEAFKWTMYGGFGVLRVKTEYASPMSFRQVIRLEAIADPTHAFFDPSAQAPDKSDGEYCGVYETLDSKTFRRRYPKAQIPQGSALPTFDLSGTVNESDWAGWQGKKTVTVVDYFVKEPRTKTLVQLSDGTVCEKADGLRAAAASDGLLRVIAERTADDYTIYHYKLTRDEVLEKSRWPAKRLPLVFVDGDSFYWQGQQRTKSFVHYAKDAQRYLNYVASESALAILTRRKEEWLATPDNIRGREAQWADPAQVRAALIATPDRQTGLMPQKLPATEIPQTLTLQYERAKEDIRVILGRFDANLGMPSNERSGIAINQRVKQGNAATFVYFDNINRAVESVARIVLDLIPAVMDTTQTVPIRQADGTQQLVDINAPSGTGYSNHLAEGEFTVTVEAGPNYAVQKAESLQQLLNLARHPQILALIPDLIAENLDVENMPQIVKRLKTLLPPQVLAAENGTPPPPSPPNVTELQANLEQQRVHNEQQKMVLEREKLAASAQAAQLKAQAEMEKARLAYDTARMNQYNHNHTILER